MVTLPAFNAATEAEALNMLAGLYEHSPWVAREVLERRPFVSLAHLKYVCIKVLEESDDPDKIALIRAHPELAGKAMANKSLTVESSNEQSKAGLTQCTTSELELLKALNSEYFKKFGFPFILAVRGPRGIGLQKSEIIRYFERRLVSSSEDEIRECVRNIHRIAELRLNDIFGYTPTDGNSVWDKLEILAQHSDSGYKERGELSVTYLTDAHRACADKIQADMLAIGFDKVHIDAVGNVVGVYFSENIKAKTLLTGSHYDTVRNGGKYDGRLGIYVPMESVKNLVKEKIRLPFHIEVVAFSEEEGQRYKATFLGSSALVGKFDPEWLLQKDADGITMKAAMSNAGLNFLDIPAIHRNPCDYLGFVEVHIEQGPVLNEIGLALGVVTSINGSVRYLGQALGTACHAGTTPMNQRSDAAVAVAELIIAMENCATQADNLVATVGQLTVPNGSINVVPGHCTFSLDMRAPTDNQRDALEAEVLRCIDVISSRRNVSFHLEETVRVAAAPSDPIWQNRWEKAVNKLGIPTHKMNSGAGHDSMKLHELMPQAMLFVRGQNRGISHNPLESTTSDDIQLAINAFNELITQLRENY